MIAKENKFRLASMFLIIGMLISITPLIAKFKRKVDNVIIVVNMSASPDGTRMIEMSFTINITIRLMDNGLVGVKHMPCDTKKLAKLQNHFDNMFIKMILRTAPGANGKKKYIHSQTLPALEIFQVDLALLIVIYANFWK